jgi:hypothetical protein
MPIERDRAGRIMRYSAWWICLVIFWYGLFHRSAIQGWPTTYHMLVQLVSNRRPVRTKAEAINTVQVWLHQPAIRRQFPSYHEVCKDHVPDFHGEWLVALLERDPQEWSPPSGVVPGIEG